MFKFIRRVSTSLLPRPDRPWRDDATSNAPTIGRKRRFSVTEQDDSDSPESSAKKVKGEAILVDGESAPPSADAEPTTKAEEGEDVKSVTEGVKEVDLEDKSHTEKREVEGGDAEEAGESSTTCPEVVPLPESPQSDELESGEPKDQEGEGDSVGSSSGSGDEVRDEEEGKDGIDEAEPAATTTTDTPSVDVPSPADAAEPTPPSEDTQTENA
ncbi:hypothetical protein HYDPIDRAFT_92216 [Hydnomerulius pinastri MD-312]|uniref:Unplaced genomic scaffold scaffold_16, whole genome shotgun sequence n=1 Tax=Hydnomerulius pinastri MD-312 TaxID=994086 RepID=A0A0C9VDP4_9AGAM|nr:hypothetical protein HYDPIDRAFT_92216 [Hydnomerulius pinastri MD-312]